MPLINLQIPAGVYRNGTDLQSLGRWRDANLVRWIDGTMRPVGGWRTRSDTAMDAPARGMIAWSDNSGGRWVAAGTYDALYVYSIDGTQYDITPTGLTGGRIDAGTATGYGAGLMGSGAYGIQRPASANILPATSWALDNWGQNLVVCNRDDGNIYEWDANTANDAALIATAPTDNTSIVVTAERFLVALGAGGDPRLVQWSDREDNTTWTPSATNEAGDLTLQTNGKIEAGVSLRGQTLILTDTDAHVMNYIGPPYVYGIEKVGSSCGLAAHKAVAVVDAGAFWMGTHSFYMYTGGAAQELNSDVSDYVFSNINAPQISKAFAVANSKHGEIWWFYPSEESLENDAYVVFNYIESTWYIGSLARTAGVDFGAFRQPIWADANDYKIYEHEVGLDYGDLTPFAESGPIMIGTGDTVAKVVSMIPDEKTQGDVSATFKTRFYPNGEEREYGPYSMSNPTSLRFTGRQMRIRLEGERLADWRVGVNRLDIVSGGRR
jgi:hypothetical protein